MVPPVAPGAATGPKEADAALANQAGTPLPERSRTAEAPGKGRSVVLAGSFLTVPVLRLPTLSPDGTVIAYVEQRAEVAHDSYVSTLYVRPVDAALAGPRATFAGPVTALVFAAADDLLVAVGDRLWRLLGAEAPVELWRAPGPIVRVSPRPEGRSLIVSVLSRLEAAEAPRRVRTDRHKADGRGPLPEVADAVWLVSPAVDGGAASVRRVGREGDDYRQGLWSPDGRSAIAIAHRFDEEMHQSRIVELSAEGEEVREVSPVADIWTSAFAPDQSVVWAARPVRPGAYAPYRIFERRGGGAITAWAEAGEEFMPALVLSDWRWPSLRTPFLVAPDGASVVALVQEGSAVRARRYHRAGPPTTLVGDGRSVVSDIVTDASGRHFAYSLSTPTSVDDIVFMDEGGASRRLTDAMSLWPQGDRVATPEFFTVRAPDGGESECAWLPPSGVRGPAPTVLVVHGGPHGAWGANLYLEHNILSALGFGVLWVNPRGSSGYGVEFANQVVGHWGEGDMADLLAALDRMVESGRADPERLAVMGTSYGGFMSAWLIGHDDRFRTAVVQAPLTNHISFFGTSDIGPFFVRHQLGVRGLPTDLETMWDKSPLKYAPNVTCPVLMICGENDDRCPISQSEEYYTALRQKGIRTEFLRYPGASHGLGSIAPPSHRLHRQKAVVAWLSEHLLGGEEAESARAATAGAASQAAMGADA